MRKKSKSKKSKSVRLGADLALLLRSRFSEKKKDQKKFSRKRKHKLREE